MIRPPPSSPLFPSTTLFRSITVPAKLFIDFVNSLPPGNVELSLNVRTKTVHLKSGPYEANIKGMDAEEFPIIPQIPEKPTDRKSTRLNSSHSQISYAVFCLK